MSEIIFTFITPDTSVRAAGCYPDELVDKLVDAINALAEYDRRDKIYLKK